MVTPIWASSSTRRPCIIRTGLAAAGSPACSREGHPRGGAHHRRVDRIQTRLGVQAELVAPGGGAPVDAGLADAIPAAFGVAAALWAEV